jgi:methionyl-tRNA formyltransferase
MTKENCYLVAGSKPWNREVFEKVISRYPGSWKFISQPDELNRELLERFGPRFIFFLHWSTRVPADILAKYECVCFHMTDVPYGRGGSPLQNLIVLGHRQTKLTALKMVEEFDAGPFYLKEDLSLEGKAEEIYRRACVLSAKMIQRLISEPLDPQPQQGDTTIFHRRRPADSEIPALSSLEAVYDFIRMLDADGYPHAFLDRHGFRYEFVEAKLSADSVVAQVYIRPLEEQPK